MQLQGLPARNRTRVLRITRPVLYHWATEAVADNLARVQYIYINEIVMPVNAGGIYTRYQIRLDQCQFVLESSYSEGSECCRFNFKINGRMFAYKEWKYWLIDQTM